MAQTRQLVLTFDGQVLEVFGWTLGSADRPMVSSARFHVDNMYWTVDEPWSPDDPESLQPCLLTLGIPGSLAGDTYSVDRDEWPDVEAFLSQVTDAVMADESSRSVAAGWDEVRTRDTLLAFDGRILEVFRDRLTNGPDYAGDSLRFHVARLILKERQDRKGQHRVRLETGISSATLRFEDDEWTTVGPFLSRVAAAAARFQR